MKNKTLTAIVATGALIFGAQQTQATAISSAQLMLDDPTTFGIDVLVPDNGIGDLNPLVGAVVFSGAVGTFVVNVSTGTTAPILPGPYPHLDLASVNVASGAGTIIIGFTDMNQTAVNTGMTTSVGGTMSQGVTSVTFSSYIDNGNVPFGQASPVSSFTFLSGPAYSATDTAPVSVGAPYSASIFATIVATGPGTASFDLEYHPAPDGGSTAALLGVGMLGCAAAARRRKA